MENNEMKRNDLRDRARKAVNISRIVCGLVPYLNYTIYKHNIDRERSFKMANMERPTDETRIVCEL